MNKTFAKIENATVVEVVTLVDRATDEECHLFLMKYSNNYPNWVEVDPNIVQSNFFWDQSSNRFLPPKLYQSWVFNENTQKWQAPVSMPVDGKMYWWDEGTMSWVEFVQQVA